MSGSRSGPLGSIRRRSDARSGTRGGVERRSSAATGGGGEAAVEGHARDVVAVQPRLRARVLELDRGPARHEGRVPERAVVRHRQRRDEEREERRRHGDGERGAGHLERRTDPRTRRGRGGESARAEAPTSRAGRRARGGARARAGGNSSPAFGGSPTERRPPVVVQTNSRSSSRAALVRPPAAPHICKSSNSGPETRPRRALRVVRHSARRERGGRERSHEMQSLLSPSLMLRSASVALCRGVGCVLSRSRPSPSPPRAPRPRA